MPAIWLFSLASILGGFGTPVGLAYLLVAAGNRRIMGSHAVRGWLAACGWAVAVIVSAASLALVAQQLTG